jgi:CRISPR-associated protein Cas1
MEVAIETMDLPRLLLSYPQGAQRLANLEALRGLANQYEERARMLCLPASAPGLIGWLQRLNAEGRDAGVEATGANAVRVLTYHAAKGLEWPVVVLAELDHEFVDIWKGISVHADRPFCLDDPLAGRAVRYWLSPFDRQSAAIPFLDRLRRSATAQELARRSAEESIRLLYVGFTRARDHLVLASRSRQGVFQDAPWLKQVLQLPRIPEDGEVTLGHTRAAARWLRAEQSQGEVHMARWFKGPSQLEPREVAAVAASAGGRAEYYVLEEVVLGRPLPVRSREADVLGTAVHAFLAAPAVADPLAILHAYGQEDVVSDTQLRDVAGRFESFIQTRYPGGVCRREWPLACWKGGQEVWGQADLLVELDDGWVVIDYKTSGGSAQDAAREHGNQLDNYALALNLATGKPVVDLWLYQVFAGRMVRIGKEKPMAKERRKKVAEGYRFKADPVTALAGDKGRIPELVPARMLNEFVYCPRLGFLEWVDGEWSDNEFTEEGRYRHRRVDARAEAMPKPEVLDEEGRLLKVRSVTLSAPDIALIARMDLVEIDGTAVSPVDYKRGRRPNIPAGAWDPERVQLCAQGLILQENGYRTSGGYLYYTESRERVYVPFDDELIKLTVQSLMSFRDTALRGETPPPLQDSKKCTKCSLNGICLPDEVNFLNDRLEETPRRLMPPSNDALPVYIQEQGLSVGLNGQVLEVRERGELRQEIRLIDVSQLNLMGNIQISSQAVRELCKREIPICYYTMGGRFSGMTTGLMHKNIALRQAQFRAAFSDDKCLEIARMLVASKITNARVMLQRNHTALHTGRLSELKEYIVDARGATSLASLLGVEGSAARVYFGEFSGLLKQKGLDFDFNGRERRPPPDEINSLLGLAYAWLYKDFMVTTQAVGLDPYQGFYHQPRYGRGSLALDLMEEFRPIIADSVVITAVNTGVVGKDDFVRAMKAVSLLEKGRKAFLAAYERRMEEKVTHPVFKYKVTYRQLIEMQTRLVARYLMGEVPEFPSYNTR